MGSINLDSFQCDRSHHDGSLLLVQESIEAPDDDDHILIIDNTEPSYENALLLNQAYQSELLDLLQKLEFFSIKNRQRQELLTEEIHMLSLAANELKTGKPTIAKIPFSLFGMPYFKDRHFNTAPKNEDCILGEMIGVRNFVLPNKKQFTKFDDRKLLRGLKEQAVTNAAKRLLVSIQNIQNRLQSAENLTVDERKHLETEKEILNDQINNIHSAPEDKILNFPPTAIDWQRISIVNFHGSRSPDELRLYWTHYLRPGVNCRPWTDAENKKLKEIVKDFDSGVEWVEVALRLGTNRTVFDCFRRFQGRYNDRHRKFGWSVEENEKLIELISGYNDKTTSEIDWERIRQHFPGKSKSQIYNHFRYHVRSRNIQSGMLLPIDEDQTKKNLVKEKTIQLLRNDLLGEKIQKDPRATIGRPRRLKKTVLTKEKQLKQILRPLIPSITKRPRRLSLPGDGREHGITLTCLYRLLNCNFTLIPKGNLSEEQVKELGIPPQHVSAFVNLRSLTKDLVPTESWTTSEGLPYLPPTLNTLIGFRGFLLHRNYLQSSAADGQFIQPEVPDLINEQTEYMAVDPEPLAVDPSTEKDENPYFGNKKADSILLSRMMSLFFWPGIMSTMYVSGSGVDPSPDERIPKPANISQPKISKMSKEQIKEMRRKNIQFVNRRRFGGSGSTEETEKQPRASTSWASAGGFADFFDTEAAPTPVKKIRTVHNFI